MWCSVDVTDINKEFYTSNLLRNRLKSTNLKNALLHFRKLHTSKVTQNLF